VKDDGGPRAVRRPPRAPFAEPLRDTLAGHLARFERRSVPVGERRPAAVAVVVVPDGEGQAAVLLTVRASGLRRHGGQWALPGGRLDPGEAPEAEVAVAGRETRVAHYEQPVFAWR